MVGAPHRGADFNSVNLRCAFLQGADLSGASLRDRKPPRGGPHRRRLRRGPHCGGPRLPVDHVAARCGQQRDGQRLDRGVRASRHRSTVCRVIESTRDPLTQRSRAGRGFKINSLPL
ncbi:pentapeptide repeat-containing protein [Streptomyces sp. NPDC048281]|uniref:pentapeptide repeat-containing protein n=1 Tax=Streptomyces sp. NPDC048281 TaxID=3154715 RepID=UPI00342301FA